MKRSQQYWCMANNRRNTLWSLEHIKSIREITLLGMISASSLLREPNFLPRITTTGPSTKKNRQSYTLVCDALGLLNNDKINFTKFEGKVFCGLKNKHWLPSHNTLFKVFLTCGFQNRSFYGSLNSFICSTESLNTSKWIMLRSPKNTCFGG